MKKAAIFFLSFNILFAKNCLIENLDNDLEKEKICWHQFAKDKEGIYYQLFVIKNGTTIWQSKKSKKNNPFLLASYDCGDMLPQIVADINKDFHKELLIQKPSCEGAESAFKILQWKNNKFYFLGLKYLILQKNTLFWKKNLFISYQYPWVEKFFKWKKKIAILLKKYNQKNQKTYIAKATIQFIASNKAVIKKWLLPFSDIENFSYKAYISKKDHYNSNGVKLTKPFLILWQDRANFYRQKGDIKDQFDPLLDNPLNRQMLPFFQIKFLNLSKKEFINKPLYVEITINWKKRVISVQKIQESK